MILISGLLVNTVCLIFIFPDYLWIVVLVKKIP